MGCDIHAFVEYRKPESRFRRWDSFGGRMNPGRNYLIFAHLAKVRVYEDGDDSFLDARGWPNNVSWGAFSHHELWVTDADSTELWEGAARRSSAERWVKEGISKFTDQKQRVTNPDCHSHSWVTLKEFSKILNKVDKSRPDEAEWNKEYRAIAAAMQQLESEGYSTRFVFCFDN